MVIPGTLLLLACFLYGTFAADVHATGGYTFAVIGDWGCSTGGDFPEGPRAKDYAAQVAVATALGNTCAEWDCKFVINVGDSFHDSGIRAALGVKDPQFDETFQQVYTHKSLLRIPFYGVLGHHDYGASFTDKDGNKWRHSTWPLVEYTHADPTGRWQIPGRHYSVLASPDPPIYLTAIDSTPFADEYCKDPTSPSHTPELAVQCQEKNRLRQVGALRGGLRTAQINGFWSFVVAHHPLYPDATEEYSPYNVTIPQVLKDPRTSPHAFFHGHNHLLASYSRPDTPSTLFVQVGSSGRLNDRPGPSIISNPPPTFELVKHGFALVTVNNEVGTVRFFAVDPNDVSTLVQPPVVHSEAFQKNMSPNQKAEVI